VDLQVLEVVGGVLRRIALLILVGLVVLRGLVHVVEDAVARAAERDAASG
jgi:hypothetical protein